jgi:hypothetical protein
MADDYIDAPESAIAPSVEQAIAALDSTPTTLGVIVEVLAKITDEITRPQFDP